MKPGTLIVLEGLDGSGKSTQAVLLAAALRARGHAVLETREPTRDGRYGRRIRGLAASARRIAPEEELRWFVEDRRFHVAATVRPALAVGTVVLSDRYFLSSVAYQGARGLDPAVILAANEAEFPLPDLALILEIPVEDGLARVRSRPGIVEPGFEQADLLGAVAEVFGSIDRPYLARVDGRGPVEEVQARIASVVGERLGLLPT